MTTPANILDTAAPGQTMHCHLCCAPVEVPGFLVSFASRAGILCGSCSQKEQQKATREAMARCNSRKVDGWKELCPADFQKTVAHRLPSPSKLDLVLRWQYGPRGLTLYGPTSTGKSRIAWKLMEREYHAGRKVMFLNHSSGLEYGALFSYSAAVAQAWCKGMIACDLLLLDDVFKAKLTDSFEAALFSIVSSRTEQGRPVIATMNDTGDSLMERMSDDRGATDRGPALVRRLREYSEGIAFT